MMKKLAILFILFSLATPAYADSTIDGLLAAGALAGTESVPIFQTANPAVRTTTSAIGNAGTLTGDATKSVGSTTLTLATVNANVGSFGSATNCVSFTTNAKGLITAASATTCTPAIASVTGLGTGVATFLATPTSANLAAALTDETGSGAVVFGTAPTISSPTINTAATFGFLTSAGTQCLQVSAAGALSGTGAACGGSGSTGANPTATAGPTAVNGVATTFMRSDAAPAIQLGTNAQKGIVQVDGTTIAASSGVISVTAGCGLSTGSTGVVANATINAQVGTTYTVLSSDCGQIISTTNASPIAITLPQATGSFAAGWYTTITNLGAGTATITPTTSTIDGAASLTLAQFQSVDIVSNGTNYITMRGRPTNVALSTVTGLGTGVATAAGTALSAAGGLTSTIASGTAALGTSAISSAACATVVTVAATNVATTDVVSASFNGDPTAVTGYIPSTSGMLTIIGYPTSGNVNFKVCNNTSASITPGAITLNWRVAR